MLYIFFPSPFPPYSVQSKPLDPQDPHQRQLPARAPYINHILPLLQLPLLRHHIPNRQVPSRQRKSNCDRLPRHHILLLKAPKLLHRSTWDPNVQLRNFLPLYWACVLHIRLHGRDLFPEVFLAALKNAACGIGLRAFGCSDVDLQV